MIIAIDGPSGSGKSTLGKRLASAFDLVYLDTGAMYRAVGLAVLLAGVAESDTDSISKIASEATIEFGEVHGKRVVLLDGEDVTIEIRRADVSHMASVVSTVQNVRSVLVRLQQQIGHSAAKGAVLDGRDIGTVVFPEADFKFFLTADTESRAKRRLIEDLEKGSDTTFEETLREIVARDKRDATREHSPLRKAPDAIEIDTSELNADEVFEKMSALISTEY